MMLRLVAMAALAAALNAHAATIQSFELADGETSLRVRLSNGRTWVAPRTEVNQKGFSNVKIAPNRRSLGWTATFGNCCTAYPLPRALVVHDGSRVVRRVGPGSLSIFDWHYSQDSQSVVYQREFPHGNSPHLFRRIRLSDGRLLASFDCEVMDPDHLGPRTTHPPAWTGAGHLDCPE